MSLCTPKSHINIPSTDGPITFTLVGGFMSFVAAFFMWTVLIMDPKCRSQVRPRFLIVLAGFDWVSALCWLIFGALFHSDGDNFKVRLYWSHGVATFFYLGWVFTIGSFLWTICIAFHVWLTVKHNWPVGHESELRWERRYWNFLLIALGTFAIALACMFWEPEHGIYQPPCVDGGGKNEQHYGILTAIYLTVPTILIGGIGLHLQCCWNKPLTPEVAVYKKQIIVFVWVYMLLVTWAVVEQIHIAATSYDIEDQWMPYMKLFYTYIGFCNTLVWGSRRHVLLLLRNRLSRHSPKSEQSRLAEQELAWWTPSQSPSNSNLGGLEQPLLDGGDDDGNGGMGSILGRKGMRYVLNIAHLQMGKAIAKGAFGQICRGKYDQEDVAIKNLVIKADPREQQEAARELEVLSRLRHPNVVTFYGVVVKEWAQGGVHGDGQQKVLIVTELCEGSIDSLPLGLHRVSGVTIWAILTQIVAGMQYLHKMAIVHRDLKLANCLFRYDSVRRSLGSARDAAEGEKKMVLKLCDFGLSRMLPDGLANMTAGVGTPTHMAPETLIGADSKLPFALDTYSFGILSWCVLSGQQPYEEEQANHPPLEVLKMIHRGRRPQFHRRWPTETCELIQRCWTTDPAERPTFAEVAQQMANSEDMLGLKTLKPDGPQSQIQEEDS